LQPAVPRDLEIICLRCLEKKPEKRYESALALAEDVERFRTGEPIRARPVSAGERAIKWARRRPATAALLLLSAVALLGLVGAGWWYAGHEHRQRQAEEALRRQADQNFRQALDVVDRMVTRVAEEQLAHEPRMTQVRQQWLEYALQFYTQFLQGRGDEPELRRETARAYQRVGDIYRLQRQTGRAEEAYSQAIRLLHGLVQDFSEEPVYQQDLAASYNWLGEVLRTSSRPREARTAYREARTIQEQLVAAHDQPEYRRDLALGRCNVPSESAENAAESPTTG
jgi:tetratricopeptide (TPR) repeat protein